MIGDSFIKKRTSVPSSTSPAEDGVINFCTSFSPLNSTTETDFRPH